MGQSKSSLPLETENANDYKENTQTDMHTLIHTNAVVHENTNLVHCLNLSFFSFFYSTSTATFSCLCLSAVCVCSSVFVRVCWSTSRVLLICPPLPLLYSYVFKWRNVLFSYLVNTCTNAQKPAKYFRKNIHCQLTQIEAWKLNELKPIAALLLHHLV